MGMTEKNVCVCVYAMTSPCGKRAHVCDTNMFLFQKGYHTPPKKNQKRSLHKGHHALEGVSFLFFSTSFAEICDASQARHARETLHVRQLLFLAHLVFRKPLQGWSAMFEGVTFQKTMKGPTKPV